jgi:DNA-binding XRE family transcriptional regulator
MPTRKFRELVESMPAERQQRIAKRVRESLASMPLEEIRKARQMTQAKLAETLGVNQGEISKIEHRTDIYISTLAGYVEALGGKLEIRAIFPEGEMRISQFEELP